MFAYREQVGLQLRHVKHIHYVKFYIVLHLVSTPTTINPIPINFGHAIITQLHVIWKHYIVGVKCRPMQSHVLGGSIIHHPFVNASQMRFVLRCKFKFVLVLHIFSNFPLIVVFYSKITQRSPVCRNRNMFLRLAAKAMNGEYRTLVTS